MKTRDSSDKIIHLNARKKASSQTHAKISKPAKSCGPKIIAITSGKGGVGKSNIVANLGFTLCRFGKKVLVFDADLGLGNLDILLGLTPQFNLSHVIRGEKLLADIVIPGPGRMKILPASSGVQEMTSLSPEDRYRVFSQLEAYIQDFDVMLIDTAAGISSNVLFFNINADEVLVVTTPEPTSITDAYALMKVLSVNYGTDQFKLVVNSAASAKEADDVYRQLSLVTDRFLKISIEYYGSIMMDEELKKGVRQQKVISQIAPLSKASRSFIALARRVSNTPAPDGFGRTAKWCHTVIPSSLDH